MHIGNDPQDKLMLSAIERMVLQALAGRIGDAAMALRAQVARARVRARTHSGVGFVTRLEVPEGVGRLPPEAVSMIRPVYAAHPRLSEPAEFIVQVRDGYIASIEAYCCAGVWPEEDALFQIESPVRG